MIIKEVNPPSSYYSLPKKEKKKNKKSYIDFSTESNIKKEKIYFGAVPMP